MRLFLKELIVLALVLRFSGGRVVCTKRYDFSENQAPCETYDLEHCDSPHIPPSCPVIEISNKYPCLRYICIEKSTTATPNIESTTSFSTLFASSSTSQPPRTFQSSTERLAVEQSLPMLMTTDSLPESMDAIELLNKMKEKLDQVQRLREQKQQDIVEWWNKNRIHFSNSDETLEILLAVALIAAFIFLLIICFLCCKKCCPRGSTSSCQSRDQSDLVESGIPGSNDDCARPNGGSSFELASRNNPSVVNSDLNVNGLMMPLLNVQNVENVYENVENPGPSTSGRTAPAPLNVIEPEVRNDLPVEPDFLGFDDDSSDDGYNSEFWRLQLQADLPETDDDSTYSPSHVQIFIPEVRRRSVRPLKPQRKLDL